MEYAPKMPTNLVSHSNWMLTISWMQGKAGQGQPIQSQSQQLIVDYHLSLASCLASLHTHWA